MTTTAPTPAASQMAHDPESASASPQSKVVSAAGDGPSPPPPRPERSRRDGAVTNTILGVLGAAFVAVLTVVLTTTNARITRVEDKVDAGFARMDDRFSDQDDKIAALIAAQDDKIDTIDLKLTALIAALNQTDAVDAALEGRLLNPTPQTSTSGRSATTRRRP